MSKENIIIFGISKVAQIIYANLLDNENCSLRPVGFTVDNHFYKDNEMYGLPIIRFEDVESYFHPKHGYKMLIAVGYHEMNNIRMKKAEEAQKKGYSLVSFIHSNAYVSKTSSIGNNTIILSHVTIDPFVKIGNNVCIYSNAVISHHSVVNDNTWIASGTVIAGNSEIGKNSFLGVHSTIGHNIKVGSYNFIGAGATITKSTNDNSVYVIHDTDKYSLNTEQFMKLTHFN